MAAQETAARRTRRRRGPGWVPNQHGAWAMLVSPFLVGVAAAGPRWVHLPLFVLWIVGYLAFYATGLWLKSRRRPRYLPPVRAYAVAIVPLGLLVLALSPGLVVWAPVFVVPLGLGLWLAARRRDRSLPSGLVTIVAACLMAPVVFDAGGGTDWSRIWLLTAVLAGYFVGTLFYVKTMIRERRSRRHHAISLVHHAAVAVAMAWVSWWLVALFALLLVRAAVLPRYHLSPKAVGLGEIAANLAVVVTALLVV